MTAGAEPGAPSIPDFCQPRSVFLLVLLGLLLAVVLVLASRPGFDGFWVALGLNALMVEGIVLASSLALCVSRPLLLRLPPGAAFAVVFVVIQLLALAACLIAAELFLPARTAAANVDWILRNLLISGIASLLLVRYLVLQRQWQLQVRAEARARLDALQARIRPHFLFNALNTIASRVRARPDEAEQAVLDLSDLLRTGLRPEGTHTLGEELDLVRGYLRLESQRLGDRLKVAWHLEEELDLEQQVPALLIQPLVENAVVHGVARIPEGGTLHVALRPGKRGGWRVRVENPLPPESEHAKRGDGNRMALDNIEKRLALTYGEGARLSVRADDGRFTAELRVPVRA